MKIKKTSKTNPETIEWISKHAEALFETGKGLPAGHYQNERFIKRQADTISFVEGVPTGSIALKGIKTRLPE